VNNLIRWGICQSFGKDKGLVIFNSLFGGELGKAIRNVDAVATQEALNMAAKVLGSAKMM
jgi:hypothetical protein